MKAFSWLIGLVLVALIAAIGFFVLDHYNINLLEQPGGNATTTPQVSVPAAGPLTVRGIVLCLPHKNTDGPQTLECAYGIKETATGRYFGLGNADNTPDGITDLPFNSVEVEVTGIFTPRSNSNYQDIGVIEVSAAKLVDAIPVKMGETASAFGVAVVPTAVLEDSRCPIDVQCIQAGTVRIRATLASAMGTAPQTFELGKPITTEAEVVTLVRVDPAPRSTDPQGSRVYTFHFDIAKRPIVDIDP